MPLLGLIALLLLAPPASAAPVDDYRAVHHDWEKDGQITRCYWTQKQLENAREIARLATKAGKVVSQYGYGRYRNTKRF